MAADISTMVCPGCGAPMILKPGKDYLSCDYCGTMHFPEANPDGVRVLGEPAEAQCPRCSVPLVQATLASERILYCDHCHGILVNMGAFLAVVEDLRSRHESSEYTGQQPDWNDLDHRTSCPQCGKQMDTHMYAGPGNVIIDTCEGCELNWLDYGEMQRIVRAPDGKYVMAIDEDERLRNQNPSDAA